MIETDIRLALGQRECWLMVNGFFPGDGTVT